LDIHILLCFDSFCCFPDWQSGQWKKLFIHFRHSWQEKNNSSTQQPLCQIDDLDTLVVIFWYASAGDTSQNHIFLQFGKSNLLQRYNKKSECANKIYFILLFAGFCDHIFEG